jgi:hypothetical protein
MSAGTYLLVKRGLFYRPDNKGYTGIKDHAGLYSKEEAEAYADPLSGVTVLPFDEAPDFSEECFDDLARGHLESKVKTLQARIAELEALINSPETDDWLKGAQLEAAHQIERWGAEHDVGKSPWDWFWLIGFLAQKAAASQVAGDDQKAKHHTISTAAALLNWHRHLTGADQRMRPGIDPVARGVP